MTESGDLASTPAGQPDTGSVRASATPAPELTPDKRSRAMRDIIFAQCFGCLAMVAFRHGLILLFLSALGFGGATIVICLALPQAMRGLLTIPGAYFADRYGKKLVGGLGLVLTVTGFALLCVLLLVPAWLRNPCVVFGILLYAIGNALWGAGWFALLSPIVPEAERGGFFGKLRFSWQSAGIVFFMIAGYFLHKNSSPALFVPVMLAIAAGLLVRIIYYVRIPEVEKSAPRSRSFADSFISVLRTAGYMSFCAYVFLLSLATIGCVAIFGLVEKKVLLLRDPQVVWLGNLGMMGAVTGFLLIGKLIDRWGTKPAFLICHFGFGLSLFLFVLRGCIPDPTAMILFMGAIHFAFGLMLAGSSVAISTEMLALIPSENKSLATSVCMTLNMGGGALAGFLIAGILKLGVLREQWQFHGLHLSNYDTVLLACGVAVVLLVVTLGLVPSVINKARYSVP